MLASLLGALLSGEASAAAKRLKTQIIVLSLMGGIALLALVFLILAAYIYAAGRLGPLQAALWFGGVLLAVAVLGFVINRVTSSIRARRAARRRKAELTTVAAATALAALPALASRGGAGLLIAPFLAAAGYQIYKENSRPSRSISPDDASDL